VEWINITSSAYRVEDRGILAEPRCRTTIMNHELNELVHQAEQSLQKARESTRTSQAELANAQQALAALLALCGPSAPVPAPSTRIAIGRRLTNDRLRVSGSCSPRDASVWCGVVEAAFQGLSQVLDVALAAGDDNSRRELARVLLPVLRQLLAFLEGFCATDPDNMTESPCNPCTKKQDCKALCERLKAHLDDPRKGKLPREITGGLDFSAIRARRGSPEGALGDEKARKGDRGTFRDVRTVEPYDALESYRSCWEHLSHKQQEVVQLYYGEGKGITEVAEHLDKSPSTVHGLLSRARDIKEKHNERMRREELGLLRELETKIRES